VQRLRSIRRAINKNSVVQDNKNNQVADDEDHDYPSGVSDWLQDAGRRRVASAPAAAPESDDEVLGYLESLTGKKLRSRSAIDRLFREFAADEARRLRELRVRNARRHCYLLALVAVSFLHYYYWDVSLQIAALPEMKVFVPIQDRDRGIKAKVQRS